MLADAPRRRRIVDTLSVDHLPATAADVGTKPHGFSPGEGEGGDHPAVSLRVSGLARVLAGAIACVIALPDLIRSIRQVLRVLATASVFETLIPVVIVLYQLNLRADPAGGNACCVLEDIKVAERS